MSQQQAGDTNVGYVVDLDKWNLFGDVVSAVARVLKLGRYTPSLLASGVLEK